VKVVVPILAVGGGQAPRAIANILLVGVCAMRGKRVHGEMDEPSVAVSPAPTASSSPLGFEEFFEVERGRLFRALLMLTRNVDEAEELLQDSFCRVWERWDDVRSMDSPTGYLYRTAMNRHRSAYRRAVRGARRAFVSVERSDEFAAAEARDEALALLATLSERQRAAVILTELLGFSSEEAGKLMGVRAGTVRVLVSRARAAIARSQGVAS
jgi:RNA polymerase sigma-70 factor (ECF subfamily)